MFPAPSTRPTPPVDSGCRASSPADARTVCSETPGVIQTSALKPCRSRLSKALPGSTGTLTRPPGAVPSVLSAIGLVPAAMAPRECCSVRSDESTMYGPEIHSSPTKGESGSRFFARVAAVTQRSASAATLACTRLRRSIRWGIVVFAHRVSPSESSLIAASSAALRDSSSGGTTAPGTAGSVVVINLL
jgi:hypothetical protein